MSEPAAAKSRVVVLGAGFAGLALLKELRTADAEIVVVDRRNYHLFQPLLYEVATAALSAVDIAEPIRAIMRDARNVTVCLDEAIGIDREKRTLLLADAGSLHYDILVVASGVDYNYFGHDEWASYAPSLKSAADAIEIRRRLLLAFEGAERTNDLARRRRLLTFVLVGGGPTGVELAGSIAGLARLLAREFRRADTATARVILVEAGPHLLGGFSDRLASYALEELTRLRVEVRLSSRVDAVSANGVETSAGPLDAGLVIWCAGVRGSAPGGWLGISTTERGTVPVTEDLSLAGHPEIFVIGDLAHVTGPDGGELPNLAT
ncbi:MAG: NAD(P)/FAD-dependent oxidoreductase, partial [Acetobacteraceae bacterium]